MQHTGAQMLQAGLGDLVLRVVDTFEANEPPNRQLLQMLDALHRELQHHDLLTTQRIMRELARTVRTETGEPPDGMRLDLSDAHQNLYGVQEVDLMPGVEMTHTLHEIETLRVQLAEDPDPWR
jgi:hypothetical protein